MNGFWTLMAEVAARSAILGLCVGLGLAAWRRTPAKMAHAAWTAVLVAMFAMPVLTVAAPRLRLQILPPAAPVASASPEMPSARSRRAEAGEVSPAARGTVPAAAVAATSPGADGWRSATVGVYALGLCLGLVALLRGLATLRRLRRARSAVDDPVAGALLESLLPGRAVTVWSSSAVSVPLTFGFLRPSILLPEDWRSWSPAKLEAVLAHEASHVRRGDAAWLLVAHLNRCVHWFNPFSWFLLRRLSSLAEEIGDDAAVG